jgi:Uma2 family endonuclease
MTHVEQKATLADLYLTPGKAELIGGKIVEFMPTGRKPNRIAGRIYRSLDDHAGQTKKGEAFTDNMGYAVPTLPSGRESFSPDASYHAGPFPTNIMNFIAPAPTFAAEVRSERDCDADAEIEMAEKRLDYFTAGTQIVWDVDTKAEVIHVYRHDQPDSPMTYRRGQTAEAESAVPGWRVEVDWIFG